MVKLNRIIRKIYYFIYGKENQVTVFSWNYLYRKFINRMFIQNKQLFYDKTIADYGAGSAPYFKTVQNICKKYIALDFNNILLQKEKKLFFYSLGNNGEINKLEENIDVIISNQVLLELNSLDFYLNELNKISDRNTILFLTNPWFQPLGLNDKIRYSPFFIKNKLNKIGFEVFDYKTSGYFFCGCALSLNMLLVMKNKYNIQHDNVKINLKKQVLFTPLILFNNLFSMVLDKICPLYRMPANFIIIARKI